MFGSRSVHAKLPLVISFHSLVPFQALLCFQDGSIVETKSSGSYFMTSIKAYIRACPLCRTFRPFIEVIKYEPEDFISIIKTGFIY